MSDKVEPDDYETQIEGMLDLAVAMSQMHIELTIIEMMIEDMNKLNTE